MANTPKELDLILSFQTNKCELFKRPRHLVRIVMIRTISSNSLGLLNSHIKGESI